MAEYAGLHSVSCAGPESCQCGEVTLFEVRPVPKPPMQAPKEPTKLRSRPRLLPDPLRAQVLRRAEYRCERCGVAGRLDVHHVVNRSQGGRDDAENLKALCRACHRYVTENPLKARREGWSRQR